MTIMTMALIEKRSLFTKYAYQIPICFSDVLKSICLNK